MLVTFKLRGRHMMNVICEINAKTKHKITSHFQGMKRKIHRTGIYNK